MPMSEMDAEALFGMINKLAGSVPPFLRGGLSGNTLLSFLGAVPSGFRSYTLDELIGVLETGIKTGKIRI